METIATELITGIPVWFKMIIIAFMLIVGVFWVLPKIRRDKAGKIYFYSQKYEDSKRNRKQDLILQKIEYIAAGTADVKKDILQLQICAANLPDTAKRLAYWEYKKQGLNSWVDAYVVEKGLFKPEELKYVVNNSEDKK